VFDMALEQEAPEILTQFFSAWSLREPDRILAVVSPDISITDPNGSYQGAAALHEHVVGILRSFDFAPAKIRNCFVDGDLAGDARLAFLVECPMTGRSSRLAGIETGFEAAVFATLNDGKIATWNEYWDPAPLRNDLPSQATVSQCADRH
jgi:ketosteroid isomerase-like protein